MTETPTETQPVQHVAYATVIDAGGGHVNVVVDRDTDEYPPVGSSVRLSWIA